MNIGVNKKLSVCMAVFNGDKFLDYQLSSIINNFISNISLEIIIVDDKSNDKSLRICENYKSRFNNIKINIIKNKKNLGSVSSFEKAIFASKSNIIMLCDQDDFWVKGRIDYMLNILNFNKNIDLLIGNFKLVDYKILKDYTNKYKFRHGTTELKKLTLSDFVFKRYPFYGCCMAFRSEILEKVLPFPKWIDAHDRWIAINAISNHSAYFFNEIVTIRGAHKNNQTSAKRKLTKRLKSFSKKLLMLILVIIRNGF